MVSSSTSCFNIISCAGDAADADLDLPQSKSSTDKRGWSFRKRSARHRVLVNNVSVEAPSSGDKESNTTAVSESPAVGSPTVPEKIPVSQKDNETFQLSPTDFARDVLDVLPSEEKPGNSEVSINCINDIEGSVAIVIQTAIRGYLARRGFCKMKNAIKLQAAYRGHLVRRHAVGSLHCVQAIVKMQTLVRARHASKSTSSQEPITDDKGKDSVQHEANKSNSSSAKKLLANGFARQLLETKPNTKHIQIKCDPSKPNSAWQWLERWVVTSESIINPSEVDPTKENLQKTCTIGTDDQTHVISDDKISKDSEDSGMEQRTSDGDDFAFYFSNFNPVKDKGADPVVEINIEASVTETESLASDRKFSEDLKEPASNVPDRLSLPSQPLPLELSAGKPEFDREKSRITVRTAASDPMENEGKKYVIGFKKSPNPAFAAVQSKFEELTSNASGARSSNSYDNQPMESKLECLPSLVDSASSVVKAKEFSVVEDSNVNDIKPQNVGSECATEISVTSTLDSPDRIEHEHERPMFESRSVEKVEPNPMSLANETSDLALEDKVGSSSIVVDVPSVPLEATNIAEKNDLNGDAAESNFLDHQKQEEPQAQDSSYSLTVQTENGSDQLVENFPVEDSPKGQIAVTDSLQGTPTSQVSVSSRRSKSGSSKSKKHSQISKRRSRESATQDSTERNSTEHSGKDSKTGKRRNSFDHESRVSVSSNTVPNYMQATESAKAKLLNQSSPKASPDAHEDFNVKKRHSLPTTNGKQGSPRMQRSSSHAPQNAKGNAPHSPHTERRWVS